MKKKAYKYDMPDVVRRIIGIAPSSFLIGGAAKVIGQGLDQEPRDWDIAIGSYKDWRIVLAIIMEFPKEVVSLNVLGGFHLKVDGSEVDIWYQDMSEILTWAPSTDIYHFLSDGYWHKDE